MMNSFMEDYQRGMDHLDMVSPIFAKFVRGMGLPIANPDIPTARVVWDEMSKRISFEMSPDFTATLDDESMAAAMAHETYHVLLDHLKEVRDRNQYPQAKVLQIAHECIINDGLQGNVGVSLPHGFWSGVEKFQQDFSYFSTKQAYDFILNQEQDNSGDGDSEADGEEGDGSGGQSSSDGSSSDSSESGSGTQGCGGFEFKDMNPDDLKNFQDAVKKIFKAVVDDVGVDNMPDELADMAEEVLGSAAGRGTHSTMFHAPDRTANMELDWAEILTIINPRINSRGKTMPKETWRRVPRRLTSIYPEVILPERKTQLDDPFRKGKEIPTFVVALDLSYSIPRELVNTLMKLVESVPTDIISPRAVTWSDDVEEYDERKRIVRPGGTHIDNVYRYAKKVAEEIGSDPYVLVITDGQCNFGNHVNKDYLQERWFWCAIQPQDEYAIKTNFVYAGHANERYVYKLSDLHR